MNNWLALLLATCAVGSVHAQSQPMASGGVNYQYAPVAPAPAPAVAAPVAPAPAPYGAAASAVAQPRPATGATLTGMERPTPRYRPVAKQPAPRARHVQKAPVVKASKAPKAPMVVKKSKKLGGSAKLTKPVKPGRAPVASRAPMAKPAYKANRAAANRPVKNRAQRRIAAYGGMTPRKVPHTAAANRPATPKGPAAPSRYVVMDGQEQPVKVFQRRKFVNPE